MSKPKPLMTTSYKVIFLVFGFLFLIGIPGKSANPEHASALLIPSLMMILMYRRNMRELILFVRGVLFLGVAALVLVVLALGVLPPSQNMRDQAVSQMIALIITLPLWYVLLRYFKKYDLSVAGGNTYLANEEDERANEDTLGHLPTKSPAKFGRNSYHGFAAGFMYVAFGLCILVYLFGFYKVIADSRYTAKDVALSVVIFPYPLWVGAKEIYWYLDAPSSSQVEVAKIPLQKGLYEPAQFQPIYLQCSLKGTTTWAGKVDGESFSEIASVKIDDVGGQKYLHSIAPHFNGTEKAIITEDEFFSMPGSLHGRTEVPGTEALKRIRDGIPIIRILINRKTGQFVGKKLEQLSGTVKIMDAVGECNAVTDNKF